MKILRSMVILLAFGWLAACEYPNSKVEITDERPTIAFTGAPWRSQVFVDGVEMGRADRLEGRKVLLVEPGMHVVEVRHKGKILLSEKVFLGEGATRTFVVQ